MSQLEMFEKPDGEGEVIYRMTITTKSGKVIRRANGQPFRIVIRRKRPVDNRLNRAQDTFLCPEGHSLLI